MHKKNWRSEVLFWKGKLCTTLIFDTDFRYRFSILTDRFSTQTNFRHSDFQHWPIFDTDRFWLQIFATDFWYRFSIQIFDTDFRYRFSIQIKGVKKALSLQGQLHRRLDAKAWLPFKMAQPENCKMFSIG
jgi:hypothetical protein